MLRVFKTGGDLNVSELVDNAADGERARLQAIRGGGDTDSEEEEEDEDVDFAFLKRIMADMEAAFDETELLGRRVLNSTLLRASALKNNRRRGPSAKTPAASPRATVVENEKKKSERFEKMLMVGKSQFDLRKGK